MTDSLDPAGDADDGRLVLDELADRLERFAALRDTDSAAADEVLDELGGTSDVDRDIVALYAILLTVIAGLVVPAGVVYVATRL